MDRQLTREELEVALQLAVPVRRNDVVLDEAAFASLEARIC